MAITAVEPCARRLVLHMGARKTGSSALQIFFARNRAWLADRGVVYPPASNDEIVLAGGVDSGNALALARWLHPALDPEGRHVGALDDLVQHLQDQEGTVLLSSEFLYDFDVEPLGRMVEAVRSLGVSLECVVYLRNVAGHALSLYMQEVKRGLFAGSLTDFLAEGYGRQVLQPVLSLADALAPGELRLFHYDSVRTEIAGQFVREVLTIDQPPDNAAPLAVNRSLSCFEVALMRFMNASFSDKAAARRASDALIAGPPIGTQTLSITRASLSRLMSWSADVVASINAIGMENGRLAVLDPHIDVVESEASVELTDHERGLAAMVVRLANGG